MSYCRFSKDCDVYIYVSCYGGIMINVKDDGCVYGITCKSRSEAISELGKLQNKGLKIPESVITHLNDEIREIGDDTGLESDFDTNNG